MLSYLVAASLIASPMFAECNCSPEKIEALRAKLRAEGASEKKIEDVSCEDVCEAEKSLACEDEKSTSTAEETLLAGCPCKDKKGNGNG